MSWSSSHPPLDAVLWGSNGSVCRRRLGTVVEEVARGRKEGYIISKCIIKNYALIKATTTYNLKQREHNILYSSASIFCGTLKKT
jgi:hypothetical protein